MAVAKIAITIEQDILSEVDRLVRRLAVNRLARECAKLDPKTEKTLAEEGMSGEVAAWPEY